MPSQKPSMIDALRAKHDPHYQLAGKVEGLEKDLPIQISQLHKTLSKSFVMQRKTLVRVLGLEKRVDELESAKESVQEAVEQLEEVVEEIPEELDELIDDVRAEKEVGGTATKTKPKIKAKKRKVKGKDIKPKIDAEKFKKGTALDDGYASRVLGVDEEGEYLSKEERIAKFKGKALAKPEDLKPEDKEESSDVDSEDIKQEDKAEIGEDQDKLDKIIKFLNVDVKDKIDEINQSAIEIKDILVTQGDLADDRDEALRQSILSDRKKEREKNLEKKKKSVGDKMIETVTKPVGNFLNKLIKFVMMTFVGSVIARVVTLLRDPAQLLDPIKRFFNLAIGLVNAVMKGMWNITGAPMNFIIGGINKGVSSLLNAINKATGLLKIPPIEAPQIPLIPGPPEFEYIPLSKTAQEKNEAVAMAGGGIVPGYNEGGKVQTRGVITDPEEIKKEKEYMLKFVNEEREFQGLPPLKEITLAPGVELTKMLGPGPRTKEESTTDIDFGTMTRSTATSKWVEGKGTKLSGEVGGLTEADREKFIAENPIVRQLANVKDQVELDKLGSSIGAKAKMSGGGLVQNLNVRRQGFSGGGFVPYSEFTLGTGHNVINTAPGNIMGYNKGGKVPGSGTGDTVPAMLTPGEFVMSKGAVDKIGADNLMAMNKAGGGTNVPKMMKFAGGGVVPEIGTPPKKGGKVVVIGGGGGSSAPRGVAASGSSGESRRFSSTDPNNMTIPVVKSLYNIMS